MYIYCEVPRIYIACFFSFVRPQRLGLGKKKQNKTNKQTKPVAPCLLFWSFYIGYLGIFVKAGIDASLLFSIWRDLNSATTVASQPSAGHSLSFIIIVFILTLGLGLFVGLTAESCGQT